MPKKIVHLKSSLLSIFLCILILCACTPLSTGIVSPSPTAPTKSSPTPTPPSLSTPTALPLPSGTLPGWYWQQSPNWSGYSSPQGGILGVRSQWVEPQASGAPKSSLAIWIGVGGWGQTHKDLVQFGTLAYTNTNGQTVHRVWYETIPQLSRFAEMNVYPGDTIAALMELRPGSTSNWHLSLSDTTQSTSFAINVSYPSSQAFADFIAEDPSTSLDPSAPLFPFSQFAPVSFTGAQVHYADGWHSIAALQMLQMTMIQNGKTMAYPSSITPPDSFSVMHV